MSSSQQSLQQAAADTGGLYGITRVSDWDFLCSPGMELGPDEDISKRPSLDEFDSELALFQVYMHLHNDTYQYIYSVYIIIYTIICLQVERIILIFSVSSFR